MKVVTGAYSTAKIFTDNVEEYAIAQIQMICDNEASKDAKICIMPDVHPGKVGPIGLSMTVGERILPNLIGVDMGCGIFMVHIKEKRAEYEKLDKVIRENVPSGTQIRKKPHYLSEEFMFDRLKCARHINPGKAILSMGTLGAGNHFIEVDKDEAGELYVAVHSGSRHLGVEVTEYYLREGQKYLKEKGQQVPYEMTWLEGALREAYLHDLFVVQEYAALNREVILSGILKGMKWKEKESISCIHNYIEDAEDGIILGKGLGNAEWNYSAPHGSGRLLKRSDVENKYTVNDFKKSMKGIYCSCIRKDTLDESPFAYRGLEEIRSAISETVEIQKVIRPIYNFKAGGK